MTNRSRKYFEWKSFNKRYYVPIQILDTPQKRKVFLAKKANEFISRGDLLAKELESIIAKYFQL